jgi:8-amino-7-oxononanoate synthase
MNALPPPLQQAGGVHVRVGRRRLLYFGGCDYFRLSCHPQVLHAFRQGLAEHGLNVAASRATTGNHRLYEQLERRLAQFFAVPAALLVSSGYLANLAVAQALAGNFSHALIDEQAHASLQDAAQFLDCPILKFAHCNAGEMARAVGRCGPEAKIIVLTDGMFSQDGSIAPLKAYLNRLPHGARVLIDDAHGAGVLGKNGRGTIELEQTDRRRIVQTLTLSKAFGVYGGAILGGQSLVQRVISGSRLFVGNTPMPLPLASAALKSIEVLARDRARRLRLEDHVIRVQAALQTVGFALPGTLSPILAIRPRSNPEGSRLRQILLAHGIFPSFIHYPGGGENGCFRFALSSEHSASQVDKLALALVEFARGGLNRTRSFP